MFYTVITATTVYQVRARSYVALVRALAEADIKWLGIHAVEESA